MPLPPSSVALGGTADHPRRDTALTALAVTSDALFGEDFLALRGLAATGRQVAAVGQDVEVPGGEIGRSDRLAEMRRLGKRQPGAERKRRGTSHQAGKLTHRHA